MLSIVGASGAGKSTLLHLLGTLDLPSEGNILFEGQDVTSYSSSQLAQFRNATLGFVFQFHHLLPEFSALENVLMPGLIRGAAAQGARAPRARTADRSGPRTPPRPPPRRALGGRAAARGPGPRPGDGPETGASRRTHRQPGFHHQRGHSRAVLPPQPQPRHHLPDRDPQPRPRRRMPRVVHMRDGRIERDERRTLPSTEGGLGELNGLTLLLALWRRHGALAARAWLAPAPGLLNLGISQKLHALSRRPHWRPQGSRATPALPRGKPASA